MVEALQAAGMPDEPVLVQVRREGEGPEGGVLLVTRLLPHCPWLSHLSSLPELGLALGLARKMLNKASTTKRLCPVAHLSANVCE